jgi:hypothetical protein
MDSYTYIMHNGKTGLWHDWGIYEDDWEGAAPYKPTWQPDPEILDPYLNRDENILHALNDSFHTNRANELKALLDKAKMYKLKDWPEGFVRLYTKGAPKGHKGHGHIHLHGA